MTLLSKQQHSLNGLFPSTTWINQHQKGKPFWMFMKEEMGWWWHQLDPMQMICISIHTANQGSTSSLNFLQATCFSWCPTNSVKAL